MLRIRPDAPKVTDLGRYGKIFWHQFFYISQFPENLDFATSIMRNVGFGLSRPPTLTSKIHPKIMLFQDTFLHILFSSFMLILLEN